MRRTIAIFGSIILIGAAACSAQQGANESSGATTVTITESVSGAGASDALAETVTLTVTSTVTATAPLDTPSASMESESSAVTGELGTRNNPAPVGTTATFGDIWTVTFDATDLDAWPEIEKSSSFADPPTSGEVFVSAPVHVTYNGDGSEDPGFNLQYAFVGSKGNVFDQIDHDCGFGGPGGFHDVGELFAGASGNGSVCASVPKDQVSGGVWRVQYFDTSSFDSIEGFFALT